MCYFVFSCRITPPGDFCTNTFSEPPDIHTFPVTLTTRNTTIKITLNSLPRRPDVPRVVCKMGHDRNTSMTEERSSPELVKLSPTRSVSASSASVAYAGARPKTLSVASGKRKGQNKDSHVVSEVLHGTFDIPHLTAQQRHQHYHHQERVHNLLHTSVQQQQHQQQKQRQQYEANNSHRKPLLVKHKSDPLSCDHSAANKFSLTSTMQHKKPTPQQQHQQKEQTQYDGAKIDNMGASKLKQQKSIPNPTLCDRMSFEKNSSKVSNDEGVSSSVLNLTTVESPKVLLTLKSPGQGYFSKRSNLSDSDRESSGSSPDLDRYLKGLSQQCEPLSPSQMQVYLSSLVAPRTATPSPPPGCAVGPPVSHHKLSGPTNQVTCKQNINTAIPYNIADTKPGSLKCSHPVVSHGKLESPEENGHQIVMSKNGSVQFRNSHMTQNEPTENQSSQNVFKDDTNCSSISNGSTKVTNGNTSVSNGGMSVTNSSDVVQNGTCLYRTRPDDTTKATNGATALHVGDYDLNVGSKSQIFSNNEPTRTPVKKDTAGPTSDPEKPSIVQANTGAAATMTSYRPQFIRSPTDAPSLHQFAGFNKSSPLLKSLMMREFTSPTKEVN